MWARCCLPAAAQDSFYIQRGEATIVLPSAAAAAAAAPAPAPGAAQALISNSTAWLGCIIAPGALMAGQPVELLSDVASAEECCRACRERADVANVFNYCGDASGCRCVCHDGHNARRGAAAAGRARLRAAHATALLAPSTQPGYPPCPKCVPCSYVDRRTNVTLQQGDCELRFQALVEPAYGWPPSLISKGPGVAFTGGSPIAVTGPEVPGFSRYLATGLWGQPGFACNGTLK